MDHVARSSRVKRNITAIVIAGCVGFFVWGIFIWRTGVTTQKSDHLCGVIAAIIQADYINAGTKHDPAYHYYRDHPDSLTLARLGDLRILSELGCTPVDLGGPQ